MKTLKIIVISLCFSFWGITNLLAQQSTNTSGSEASGSGGTASFTVGQIDYITAIGSGGTITQGIQQPYEIFVVTGIEVTDINLTSVYPNPASDFIVLKVENAISENFTFQLYTIQGKILLSKKIENSQTSISMAALANAIYFIKVLNNNKEVKTFKIIKN
jgi:hypothetical protein